MIFLKKQQYPRIRGTKVSWLKVSKTESWRKVGERVTEKEEKVRNHCTTVNNDKHKYV